MVVVFGRCFAVVLQFRQILGRRGLFSSKYFAAIVILAPLVDTLPLTLLGLPQADTLPPLLLEARLVTFAVSLQYWLQMCCCLHVLGPVS